VTPAPRPRCPLAAQINLDFEIEGHLITIRSKSRLVTIRVLNWMSIYHLARRASSSETFRDMLNQLELTAQLTGLKFQIVCGSFRLMTFGMGEKGTMIKSFMGVGR